MAEWLIVGALIFSGLALVIIEIIFVPGTTLVGLVGFIFIAIGVGLSFKYFGTEVGWITVGGSAVLSGILLYISFKSNLWGRFALKTAIESRVNEGANSQFKLGMEGFAKSALRPVGKAEFAGVQTEVRTLGAYLDSGTAIKIVSILPNQIIVEPLT